MLKIQEDFFFYGAAELLFLHLCSQNNNIFALLGSLELMDCSADATTERMAFDGCVID